MTVVLTRLMKSAVLAAVFGIVLFLAHPASGQSDRLPCVATGAPTIAQPAPAALDWKHHAAGHRRRADREEPCALAA